MTQQGRAGVSWPDSPLATRSRARSCGRYFAEKRNMRAAAVVESLLITMATCKAHGRADCEGTRGKTSAATPSPWQRAGRFSAKWRE